MGDESERQGGSGGELSGLRERIDQIDRRLVELLNERAEVVVEVGRLKRATGVPIYAPHREAAVLGRVLASSRGPLPARAIEAIYRELMSGSFALERPLRIGFLGPEGSYSHQAAVRHFGSSVELRTLPAIEAVFHDVRRGHADYGLVPIENSIGGGIVETLDAFRDAGREVSIYAEALLEVHHNLFAACAPDGVRRIHSKPEVFAQCRRWIGENYPGAELVTAASSSAAVIAAREEIERDPGLGSAAIASELAGQLYGLSALYERIEDNSSNITRFLVISRQRAERSGKDKTSIMFQTADKPGALAEVLNAFMRAGVNLSHIEKRPSGRVNWTYTFFVDALGHREDEAMASALEDARAHCVELAVLGSYPRAERSL